MKNIKRIMALLLVMIMSVAVVGCHKKDEIAVKIGDVEFTSAYYMCALVNANMEAKSKVQESLTDEEKQSSDIDYFSKKVEDKDYVTWVEEKAIETLKEIAAYKILCKENKIELSEEELTNSESNASYIWSNYGALYFEPNGIGENTYKQYTNDSLYSESYFKFLYGADGEKAIAADEVKTKIYDNFVIADILSASYAEDASDDDKSALKTQLESYANELKTGKKTFEQVYKEYNNTTEDASDTSSTENSAKDKYAQVMGAEGTDYASSYYDTVKAMKTGETKIEENEGGTALYLMYKQDITADPFYITDLDMQARHLIADEDFEKTIDEYIKKLEIKINNYAVKQFKVKKIVEPS